MCNYYTFFKHAANYLNFEANVSGAILPLHKIIPTLLTSGYLSLNFGTIEAAKDAPPESSTTDLILSKIVLHPWAICSSVTTMVSFSK